MTRAARGAATASILLRSATMRSASLVAALVMLLGLAALAPSRAAAQGSVTITLTQEGQDLADALGISPAELQSDVEAQVADAYNVFRAEEFLRAFADATSFSSRGIGVDYASNGDGLMVGVAGSLAFAVGDLGQDEQEAEHPVGGVAPNVAIMGGLNFARWNKPALTIYANAFHRGGKLEELEGSITSLGVHAQYKFFQPTSGKKALVLQWGGLDVTSGLELSRWAFKLGTREALTTEFDVSGGNGSAPVTLSAEGQFEISSQAVVVPLEVTTSLRLLYFLSLYGGAGLDLQLGSSDLVTNLTGTMTAVDPQDGSDVDMGTADIEVSGDSPPSAGKARFLLGLQVNIWKLKTFVQLNAMPIRSASVAFGLRVVL